MSDGQNAKITYISLEFLQPNPLQPRGAFEELEVQELSDSIRAHGVLEPLVVAHTPAGYQIVAGERRWRAAKLAGLKEVPCIVKETSPKGMLEMAIIENVQRVDLPPLDRANAFKRLLDDFHLTVGQIADRLSKSQSYVSNTLRLLSLPDALKDGLLSGTITEGHARALGSIEDPKAVVEAYKMVLKEDASVRRTEEIARRVKAKTNQPLPKMLGFSPYMVSEELDEWQEKLQKYFGESSKVKVHQSRQLTKLEFIFKGSPHDTKRYVNKILQMTEGPLPPEDPNRPVYTLDSFQTTEIVIGES